MKFCSSAPRRTFQLLQHMQRWNHTMTGAATITPAPWRRTFQSHLGKMDSPIFVLSTIHEQPSANPASPSPIYVPRARTVVFRGFWGSLPVNPKNTAPLNPSTLDSDLLTITTDVRMEKVGEMLGSTAQVESQSGIGGPVEGIFWVEEVKTQWRLRGHAYIIGPDIDSAAAAPVRTAIETYLRSAKDSLRDLEWSWSKELTAHFGNMSPGTRGQFRNPHPGKPVADGTGGKEALLGLGLGQEVNSLDDEIARSNFRVVVIVPEEVDRVDLTDPSRGRRWNYKLVDSDGSKSWEETEVWP